MKKYLVYTRADIAKIIIEVISIGEDVTWKLTDFDYAVRDTEFYDVEYKAISSLELIREICTTTEIFSIVAQSPHTTIRLRRNVIGMCVLSKNEYVQNMPEMSLYSMEVADE